MKGCLCHCRSYKKLHRSCVTIDLVSLPKLCLVEQKAFRINRDLWTLLLVLLFAASEIYIKHCEFYVCFPNQIFFTFSVHINFQNVFKDQYFSLRT